ncbi:MAG: phosphatase PAP2 family protein [Hoylesella marshii]|uniref:phosphatase PAP2 family protein n=1 Tax=Hoylesella marshii TaxID=189722 RepID=UPI003F9EE5D7
MESLFLTLLGELIKWDTFVLLHINQVHSTFWDEFMYIYSAKFVWVPLYMSFFYVLVRTFSWRVALGCLLTAIAIIALSDQICSTLIRPYVGRLRPSNLDNPISHMVHVVNDYRGGEYGFPSAHAANGWGFTCFVAYIYRRHWLTFFTVLWSLLMCWTRIYLGVHYPGDLLVGALLGFVCATVVYKVFLLLTKHQHPDDVRHVYLPVIVGLLTIFCIFVYSLCDYMQWI